MAITIVALNAGIALPAYSFEKQTSFTNSFNSSTNEATILNLQANDTSWAGVDAKQFHSFIGDSFTIKTSDDRSINLKLIDVIAGKPDINRPTYLPRKQSIIAVLKASKSDEAWIAKSGSIVADSWHHKLGNAKVLITAVKKRNGGHSIEFVLN